MIVVLDPGHGGKDPGAIGRDPFVLREADVNWSVALAVRCSLENSGVAVGTTRDQAQYVGIRERAAYANNLNADVLVSIHCNSYTTPAANGIEVLHYGSTKGEALAEAILDTISTVDNRIRNRGLKERPRLGVMRLTNMPAALVELPFMSNPRELDILAEARTQSKFARAIATGIVDYLRA